MISSYLSMMKQARIRHVNDLPMNVLAVQY
jgi:hypothetical protein